MGLVWTDAPRPHVQAAIQEIRDRQEAGGGWSQFARTDPMPMPRDCRSMRCTSPACRRPTRRTARACRVPARHAVSGRHLAREDPLVSGAAILRKRISVRPASVDLDGRHELGVTGDRADAARCLSLTPSKGLQGAVTVIRLNLASTQLRPQLGRVNTL